MAGQIPEIVIFDLDGTLLNTIEDLGHACNYALRQVGLPEIEIEVYPRLVGNGVNKLIERAIRFVSPQSGMTVETVRPHFIDYYNHHNTDCTKPYAGVTKMLEVLRAHGYRLAVASNKYQEGVERIVPYYFPGVFEQMLGEHAGCPRKPEPQIIQEIAKEHKAIMVGDSVVDIETAKRAGIEVIACTWGFETREKIIAANPDYIADTPEEVVERLIVDSRKSKIES